MSMTKREFEQRRALRRVKRSEAFSDRQREASIERAVSRLSRSTGSTERRAVSIGKAARNISRAGTQIRRVTELQRRSGLAPLIQSRIDPRQGRLFFDVLTSQLLGDEKRVKRLLQRKSRRSRARRRQNTRVRIQRVTRGQKLLTRAEKLVEELRRTAAN